MSITLSTAQNMLSKYLAAEAACLVNQSYTIGDKTYTRANLASLRRGRAQWEKVVNQLSEVGSMRIRKVLFRDD